MSTHDPSKPWVQVGELVQDGDAEGLTSYLKELPPGEVARTLTHLEEEESQKVLDLLEPGDAASLMVSMPEEQVAELIEDLHPETAAAILDEMPSSEQADVLAELGLDEAAAILAAMREEEARDASMLATFAEDVAGGLMITEFLAYPEGCTVQDVVDDMLANAEEYADYDVQYAYVVGEEGELTGVLRLRDMLLSRRQRALGELALRDLHSVHVQASLQELEEFFDRYPFFGVPVLDDAGRLVGVVRRAAVEEAVGDRASSDLLKAQGIVGGEEFRSMPTLLRARRRLSWLSINVTLNIIAASVIALYQETLTAVIALAVFLPIISDMSGCSGNQAVAVSMRELALGLLRPVDVIYVWLKELAVGVLNGIVLGFLIGLAAYLWQGNPYLGLVVGAALAVNTLVGVSIGGTVPLLLRRIGMDPALASGPILTTITDMCGFFLVLSLATACLPLLTAT